MEDILLAALDAASDAAYADVRGVGSQSSTLSVDGEELEDCTSATSVGFGVRVLVDGAWGYAASSRLDRHEAHRIGRAAVDIARASARVRARPVELVDEPAHRATWATPVEIDPFSVPLEERISTLLEATVPMAALPGIRAARGYVDLLRRRTLFLSGEGARIDQTIVHTAAGIEAVAVGEDGAQRRSYPGSFRGHFASGGWEVVKGLDLAGAAPRVADEAVALLSAPDCPSTTTTVVLDANQVMLQVHESVGHALEMDRILGMEAAFAGTSFVSPADIGHLRYGSEHVNIVADATAPGGLGTFGYDDEGVEAQRVPLITAGVVSGALTSRETAAAAGMQRSSGAMRAQGWANLPLIRMTNINLLPGAGSLEDLLSDVDDGIYMATNRSWSIDDMRKNFQFGCEIAWAIQRGRLTRMYRNPRYTGITTDLWRSCDGVAGEQEWVMQGTPNCGKGQPGQSMRVGHGTAPARFRAVRTGTGRS